MVLLLVAALMIPLGLDLYMPEENPLTVEKIELGRRLFNDRRLSRDGSIACVSCHDPGRAFSDGRAVAVGVFGRVGRRNARRPSIAAVSRTSVSTTQQWPCRVGQVGRGGG